MRGFVQLFDQHFVFIHHFAHDCGHVLREGHSCPRVFAQPEVALDDVLEKAHGRFGELSFDHVFEDGTHCVKPLRRHAQISQPIFVHQDFLDNKRGDSL